MAWPTIIIINISGGMAPWSRNQLRCIVGHKTSLLPVDMRR